MNGTAYLSKDDKGHVKLEYTSGGKTVARIWETRDRGTLEIMFGEDGSILFQKMSRFNGDELNQRIADAMSEAGISQTEQAEYSDVKLNKPCPKCSEQNLQRYTEAFFSKNEVPIMPLYHCPGCSTKSYHLTEDYLGYLVDANMEKFTGEELKQMGLDRNAFMSELKAYIIRIFASKRIMCIE